MADLALLCWSCGSSLAGVPLPFGRRSECPRCTASLHACRQCGHYDRNASKSCREPVADEVVEKEAGNFCDFFQPRAGLAAGGDAAAAQARARLAQAFGSAPATGAAGSAPAGAPHGASGGIKGAVSSAEEARRKLERMFGKKS